MPSAGWLATLELPVLARLALALALGAAIGLERELSGKPAGLRTNILICVGAELFTELSLRVALGASSPGGADPSRIAAQIVSGIGFLGAGTIIVLRGHVVGLTTAATIWVVAAIGMAVGLGQTVIAVGATALVLVTLVGLGKLEARIDEPDGATLRIVVAAGAGDEEALAGLLARREFRARRIAFDREDGEETIAFRITGRRERQSELLRRLREIGSVRAARIE